MVRSMLCLLVLALLSGLAVAQAPVPGELILGDIRSPYQVQILNQTSGSFRTLGPTTTQYQNWLTMAKNNVDLMVCLSGSPQDAFARLTPAGVYSTIAAVGTTGSPNGIDVHPDGLSYLMSTSTLNNVKQITEGGTVTTFMPPPVIPSTLNNICMDHDSGDLMLGIFSAGLLLKADFTTKAYTTITTGLGSVSSVDPEPRTGNWVITTFTSPQVRVIDKQGSLVTQFVASGANAVKVDDFTGNYYVAGPTNVWEFTPTGTAVNTWVQSGSSWTAVDVYASKQVTGRGSRLAGSTYNIDFAFPGLGNSPYVAALSLSQRPGIPIGGGVLNLTPDALFFASLAGALVGNFTGTLDAQGNATGTVSIPGFIPPGFTFFCSCVAVSGSVLQTGNTIGITVR